MYIPKHFRVEDEEVLYDFIDNNSFGIVFSTHENAPNATHLPLILDRENGYLYGHFSRANTHWIDIQNQEVLVVFQGPHSYISSSWYETNLSVPTWNYITVHVYGTVELINGKEELLHTLENMVGKYENPDSPYQIDESNHEIIEGLMKGIVGFKLNINRIEGKWKLSQNHSKERQLRVIAELEKSSRDDDGEIAALMKVNM
ncbi:FMN-binding negative transcriptional regulator [Paenibacillus sp. KN14-4R]|uniref:FMN-binding negative transcriptional regulator n=1 Tax=Paenibacillus sp. KN14-4R TaxID=3445773 RepID=UPI003FA052A1